MVDQEYENGSFKIGEICYLSDEIFLRISTGAYTSIASYYFLVGGLKCKNLVRLYFPFNKQFPSFIKTIDRTKCYRAEYIEVNILFCKMRRIYQLIDFKYFVS